MCSSLRTIRGEERVYLFGLTFSDSVVFLKMRRGAQWSIVETMDLPEPGL